MMVRVKRSSTNTNNRSKMFLQNLSVKFHFYIIIQALSIVACVGFYLILQSQEVRFTVYERAFVYNMSVAMIEPWS